jgi:hypothetical protein
MRQRNAAVAVAVEILRAANGEVCGRRFGV